MFRLAYMPADRASGPSAKRPLSPLSRISVAPIAAVLSCDCTGRYRLPVRGSGDRLPDHEAAHARPCAPSLPVDRFRWRTSTICRFVLSLRRLVGEGGVWRCRDDVLTGTDRRQRHELCGLPQAAAAGPATDHRLWPRPAPACRAVDAAGHGVVPGRPANPRCPEGKRPGQRGNPIRRLPEPAIHCPS